MTRRDRKHVGDIRCMRLRGPRGTAQGGSSAASDEYERQATKRAAERAAGAKARADKRAAEGKAAVVKAAETRVWAEAVAAVKAHAETCAADKLHLIHISELTRQAESSYAVFSSKNTTSTNKHSAVCIDHLHNI